jgi:hypothetical protein
MAQRDDVFQLHPGRSARRRPCSAV